jgi:hypothetical protein
MKFNKWTLGLAAVGVVSLTSATQAKADAAPAPNYVESATKGISISGYVDTSVNYDASGEGGKVTPVDTIPFEGSNKRDGFNLDVIELNIEKDVDASPWSSGFKVSLLAGPDAVGYNTSVNAFGGGGPSGPNSTTETSDFAVKQAYVELMAPIGNGLDIKLGVFDTIIGYEVFEAGNNPNFTRSWGYDLEPTENTGLLLTYKFSDMVSASLGVCDTLSSGINGQNNYKYFGNNDVGRDGSAHYWWKTLEGSVTVTAPQSWGFLGGSSFYLGAVNGFNGGNDGDQLNLYAGAVLNTPLKELTTGFAFDFVSQQFPDTSHYYIYNDGLYATYKATDKLSFNGRGEYGWYDNSFNDGFNGFNACYWELTGTVEYDLWANVMTRAEIRYDSADEFFNPGGDTDSRCGLGLYLNVIYKF